MSQPYPFPPGYVISVISSDEANAIESYVAPQPQPKNDPNAKPLWPMIIGEVEQRISEKYCVDSGMNRDAEALRLVASDMRSRHEFGVAKYGVPLVAKNDRDHLSDAYQEILDAVVYLRAQIETMGGLTGNAYMVGRLAIHHRMIFRIYAQNLESAIELRTILAERDG